MDCLTYLVIADASSPAARFDSTTWIALVIGCAATMYVMYRARRPKKRDPLESHPVSSSLAQQRAVERQMSNLLMELSEMARTVNATIDTRSAKLEALIDEADRRIETLRAMSANSTTSPATEPQQVAATVAFPTPESPAYDERHLRVYELSDSGQSVREIADALARPTGEIELILALRPRQVVAHAS
jgi:hypothetical protein